jgi:hypothetical protein
MDKCNNFKEAPPEIAAASQNMQDSVRSSASAAKAAASAAAKEARIKNEEQKEGLQKATQQELEMKATERRVEEMKEKVHLEAKEKAQERNLKSQNTNAFAEEKMELAEKQEENSVKQMQRIFEMKQREKREKANERADKVVPVLGKSQYPPVRHSETNTTVTILLPAENLVPHLKIDQVHVQWRPMASFNSSWSDIDLSGPKQIQHTIEGLWPYQMYQFRMRAHNKAGWGG